MNDNPPAPAVVPVTARRPASPPPPRREHTPLVDLDRPVTFDSAL